MTVHGLNPASIPAASIPGADAFRSLAESLSDPCVRCDYRPDLCDTLASEHFAGPDGPDPVRVVQFVLNRLMILPHKVVADPDPTLDRAAWLIREFDGARLVRINGMTDQQVLDVLIGLQLAGWTPRPSLSGVTPDNLAAKSAELEALTIARRGYAIQAETPRPQARVGSAGPDPEGGAARQGPTTASPPRMRRSAPAQQQETLL